MQIQHILKFLSLIIGITMLGSNSPSEEKKQTSTEALDSINLIRSNHISAVNETNVELLLRDMSLDIIYLSPSLQPIEGKESLREFITPIYKLVTPKIEMIPKEIKIYGQVAIEWGIINGEIRQTGIDSVQFFKNKYVFVYEQNDNGKWMITKDIYNDIK